MARTYRQANAGGAERARKLAAKGAMRRRDEREARDELELALAQRTKREGRS